MDKLLWVPIDVPKIPDVTVLIESGKAVSDWQFWNFARLTEKQSSPYDQSTWAGWVRESCPELIDWFDQLPFMNLRNVKLNHQVKAVDGHVDFTNPCANQALWRNNNENEPCGYRILVRGKRSGGLWVSGKTNEKMYCNMPETTDTYVLDHTSGMHGVDDDEDRWIIFCHAEIDRNKHDALLRKSLERYKDYAIWDKVYT